jgi:hypothetical protein
VTREEILKLHELTEENQIAFLVANGVIAKPHYMRHVETLADCAFRLRDEVVSGYDWAGIYYKALKDVIIARNTKIIGQLMLCDIQDIPILNLKPIHWIQAALLTKVNP